jgi:hypothetical protein
LEYFGIENVGIFYDHLEYFWPFGIIFGRLVYFLVIWYIFPVLVCLYQNKSGNPAAPSNSRKKIHDVETVGQ